MTLIDDDAAAADDNNKQLYFVLCTYIAKYYCNKRMYCYGYKSPDTHTHTYT